MLHPDINIQPILKHLEVLRNCRICPRNCNADRFSGKHGYCKSGAGFSISSICIHKGEEPVISGDKGICNVFFTRCNLQCVYCQNHQISCNSLDYQEFEMEAGEVVRRITGILDSGIDIVGFVSPTHFVPQVKVIIDIIRQMGYNPRFVYNTNAYDLPGTLRDLEPYIDIYLPDFKYSVADLGRRYSDASDYPAIALAALKEMVRQKGTGLETGPDGYARKGVIVRHLVLPGHPRNSIGVLRTIAEEVSDELHISLMSQYYPTYGVKDHETLGRTLRSREYEMVVEELEALGFQNGWVQDLDSNRNYRPDFREDHPFES